MRVALALLCTAALAGAAAGSASERAVDGRIFYTTGGKGIFVNPDGTAARAPLVGRGSRRHYVGDGNPVAFSPDGRRVAYVCTPRRPVPALGLCVEGIDGRGLRELTRAPKNTYVGDAEPAWSRNGKRIAFVRSLVVGTGPVNRRKPSYRIAVVNADGTGLHLLPRPRACDYYDESHFPDWGPRGELVYVCDSTDPPGPTILALDLERVGMVLPCSGRHPQFSPDGSRILLAGPGGVRTMSTDARPSPDFDESVCDWRDIPFDGLADSAVWSPDGTAVAVVEGLRDVFVLRADGSGVRRIVHSRGDINESIAWVR